MATTSTSFLPQHYVGYEKAAGAGSRGGRVIGYTKKTNKAIYADKAAWDYKKFTPDEHKEAADLHHGEAKKHYDKMMTSAKYASSWDDGPSEHRAEMNHHVGSAMMHDRMAREKS